MKLDVFFDYACPFCYVSCTVLAQELRRRPWIEIQYHGCETHPRPEQGLSFDKGPPEWWDPLVHTAQNAGILLNLPQSPIPHSTSALQGMYALQSLGGDLKKYHESIFSALFLQGENIEDESILSRAVQASGMIPEIVLTQIRAKTWAHSLQQDQQLCWNILSLEAVPALSANNRRLTALPGIGIPPAEIIQFLESL